MAACQRGLDLPDLDAKAKPALLYNQGLALEGVGDKAGAKVFYERSLALRGATDPGRAEVAAALTRVGGAPPAELRDALLSAPRGADADVMGRPLGDGFKVADVLANVARHYLSRAMREADGNLTKAASLVGLANYQTLKNWLEKYKVEG
jgi:DNA-binding protein Fis